MSDEIKNPAPATPEKKPRPLWRRALKWTGITLGVIVVLFLLICSAIVWVLTPDRLTRIVEEQASEYLLADVDIDRVELTFWHTFPKMTLDIDSVRITSRSLQGLTAEEKAQLPADASRLMHLGSFHGGLNVPALLAGRISLYDVIFRGIGLNMVQVNDSVANYLILPSSGEPSDTTAVEVPDIVINRFVIEDAEPLRYRSLADTIDATVRLKNVTLLERDAPLYTLEINGDLRTPLLDEFNFEKISMGATGSVEWNHRTPMAVRLSDFAMKIDEYSMTVSTAVDFTHAPVMNELTARFSEIPLQGMLAHVPADLREELKDLRTSMKVNSTVTLSRPWFLADTILPSFDAVFEIPPCEITYQGYRFHDIQAKVTAGFDGSDIDRSVFTVEGLRIRGESVNFDLNATATNVMKDALVDGDFNGSINLNRLPGRVKAIIPVEVGGKIDGRSTFRFRLSDFSRESFHRIRADGEFNLHDITASDPGMLDAYMRHAQIKFGTNKGFVRDGVKIDSLLQVSLAIDTVSANGMGMDLAVSDLKLGVGSVNRAGSSDTTEVNPFGGRLSVKRLKFDATSDTMRARLRDASVGLTLRRFKGNARSPMLGMNIDAKVLFFGQGLNKIALADAGAQMTVHLNEQHSARMEAFRRLSAEKQDSIKTRFKAYADSLKSAPKTTAGTDMNFELTGKERSFLRRWDWNGSLQAAKGRLITPYLPLDNRVTDFNIKFSQDSVEFRDVKLKSGQSDFRVTGSLTNLRRALIGRRDNTLKARLRINADTVNVNEIVNAIFAGPALASQVDSAMIWNDDQENETARMTAIADTVESHPLLLPVNLDAHLRVKADHILYSDMLLHDFRGDLLLYDGALNLRNLSASTEIGSIDLNGLYAAARPDSLQFGLGMKVHNFRLDRLTSIVPAIDTIFPLMNSMAGIVNADVAVTTDLMPNMDINIPSLRGVLKISGDSLVLMDPATFKTVSKWLLFRNKEKNMIDHMDVEAVIENSGIEIYPFIFDIDRYRLGVMGSNDMAMNMSYHVSVLKSPLPFKFGINIKGNTDKMKIRLGGAKVKPGMVVERQMIADSTRVNLVEQIDKVFRSGIRKARLGRLKFQGASPTVTSSPGLGDERLTAADSLMLYQQGMIDSPGSSLLKEPPVKVDLSNGKKKKKK